MNNVIFIAELGINAQGNIDKMKRMCEKAHKAGATYIKGQYYAPRKVLGAQHPHLQYAIQCQFTRKEHEELSRFCVALGTPYFVSVFNVGDIGWVDSFAPVHKVASRMNKNQEFIAKVEACKKMTFMSVQPDVSQRIPERFKLLWCVRDYPAAKEDLLHYPYNKDFGLSSHCPDWTASLEAIRLGARVVENHLCESREEEGCDIPSSLTFEEYESLIATVKTL